MFIMCVIGATGLFLALSWRYLDSYERRHDGN